MSAKLPETAFEAYVGMGDRRTYRAVAAHFGVSLRAVTKRAGRESWKKRLASIETRARAAMDSRLLGAEVARRERHFRELLKVQDRSLKAMHNFPIRSATEALDVLAKAINIEGAILGMLRGNVGGRESPAQRKGPRTPRSGTLTGEDVAAE